MHGKLLPDDEHSCAWSNQLALIGSGAQIHKDLGVADKV